MGNIVAAKVVTDRFSGYSKGFGFVRYATTEEAASGIKGMDGQVCELFILFPSMSLCKSISAFCWSICQLLLDALRAFPNLLKFTAQYKWWLIGNCFLPPMVWG